MCDHHPLLCVLSPDMIDSIMRNGKAGMKRAASDTRRLTQTMRIARLTGTASSLPGAVDDVQGEDDLHRPQGIQRVIYDARNDEVPRNDRIVRREGNPATSDPRVNEAYDGFGDVCAFYLGKLGRHGITNAKRETLYGVVNYGKGYDNAYWDGHQMVFGNGDGRLFNPFTVSLDVIGHELTHGVTEHSLFGGLPYYCSGHPLGPNPGAINESISDCIGAVIRQVKLGLAVTDRDGWLIGKGLLAAGIDGRALRDMAAPGTAYDDKYLGKDNQPDHVSRYVVTRGDNGGVHANSGIPNFAVYKFATNVGDSLKAAEVLYGALMGHEPLDEDAVPQDCSFGQWATAIVKVAENKYGADARKAAVDAWAEVGVLTTDGNQVG
jgi:Zn-dependent metalloprotease